MWVQQLFLKAETLDFVEILSSLKRDNIVCADSSHWIICWVTGCVKCQSSFSRRNLKAVHAYLTNWFHLTTKTTDVIIIYISLTPWDRVLFQNLTPPWLVMKFPAFYGLQDFITMFTRASQSQMRPVYTLSSYFLNIHFKIILPSVHRCSKWLFPSGFPTKTQNPVCISLHPHARRYFVLHVQNVSM